MKDTRIHVGYLYKTDGTVQRLIPENGKSFSYEELKKFVGGYIEALVSGIPRCKQMFCNEEGMLLNLPPNPHTWSIVKETVYKNSGYPPFWRVSGNVIAILKEDLDKPSVAYPTNKDFSKIPPIQFAGVMGIRLPLGVLTAHTRKQQIDAVQSAMNATPAPNPISFEYYKMVLKQLLTEVTEEV